MKAIDNIGRGLVAGLIGVPFSSRSAATVMCLVDGHG